MALKKRCPEPPNRFHAGLPASTENVPFKSLCCQNHWMRTVVEAGGILIKVPGTKCLLYTNDLHVAQIITQFCSWVWLFPFYREYHGGLERCSAFFTRTYISHVEVPGLRSCFWTPKPHSFSSASKAMHDNQPQNLSGKYPAVFIFAS